VPHRRVETYSMARLVLTYAAIGRLTAARPEDLAPIPG
jgi:hypothetical protein